MTTAQQRYESLIKDLTKLEDRIQEETGVRPYLADECVDMQNVPPYVKQGSYDMYIAMYNSACCAAASRAEEMGMDINKLLGYNIY